MRWRFFIRMKSGIKKTTTGNILRTRTEKKSVLRPGKLKREKAYAAGTATRGPRVVVIVETQMLLRKDRKNSDASSFLGLSKVVYSSKVGLSGVQSGGCWIEANSVLSEVDTIQSIGSTVKTSSRIRNSQPAIVHPEGRKGLRFFGYRRRTGSLVMLLMPR